MENSLLRYAFFTKQQNKSKLFYENQYKNRKKEAAASRIFIH